MVCAAIAPGTARELPNEKQLCFVRFLSGAPNREMPAAARSTWSQLSTCCLRLFMQKKKKKKEKEDRTHTPVDTFISAHEVPPVCLCLVFVSICSESGSPASFGSAGFSDQNAPPPPRRPISQPPGLSHVWMQTNSHQNKQTNPSKSAKLSTSPLGQYASAPPFVAARGRSQQAIIGIFLHRLNFAGNGPPAPVCFWFQLNFSAG